VKRIILYVVLSMILAGIGWFGLKASREAVAYEQVTAILAYFMLSLREFTFFGALAAGEMLYFGLTAPILMVTIHKEVEYALAAGEMLYFGLTAPILMVTIHKEVEYLGDVVLSFESKSVIGSIVKLFENGDTIVALTILLFSLSVSLCRTVLPMVW